MHIKINDLTTDKRKIDHRTIKNTKKGENYEVHKTKESNINREYTIPKRYQWERGEKVGAYLSHKYARDIQIFIPRDKGSSYDTSGALVHMKIIDPTIDITKINGRTIKNTKKVENSDANKIITQNTHT